jgi:CubicO group peptidase (beta-lactamase class C family)
MKSLWFWCVSLTLIVIGADDAFAFGGRGFGRKSCSQNLHCQTLLKLGASLRFAQNPQILREDTVLVTFPLAPGEAPLQVTLAQMMAIYKVLGFSVAIIDHSQIAWAKGFGVTEAGGSTPVTPHTLFQAASISKPVTAAGALWLVQNGKLSLDEDVNLKLKSWKVPDVSARASARWHDG